MVGRRVTRWSFRRDELAGRPEDVAPTLLQSLLVVGDRVARIVEVEAYGGSDDPASHSHRGPTPRNASMFASAGTLYVYRSYGIHWCANVVTGAEGSGAAVLLRAAEVIDGLDAVRGDRPGIAAVHDLANGPGKLCAALGITGADDGTDLLAPDARVRLLHDDVAAPDSPLCTARVGITKAVDMPWRFAVPGAACVSKGRPSHVA